MNCISFTSKDQVDIFLHNHRNEAATEIEKVNISLQNQEDTIRIVRACPNLTTLSLIQCDISNEGFHLLADSCSKITRLSLFKLEKVSDEGFDYLKACTHLQRIKINNLPLVSEGGLQSLLKTNPSINKITIFLGNGLNGCAFRSLFPKTKMPPQITIIGKDATDDLAESIIKANPQVERLAIRCSGVTVAFVTHLVAYAKEKRLPLSLKTLKVTQTRIKPNDLQALQDLLPGVNIVIK